MLLWFVEKQNTKIDDPKKFTGKNNLSESAFSKTIFKTKCAKSDGHAGQCARASCSNLA